MADHTVQRRLAAVLAADVVGYTRLMEQDTDGTVAAWQSAREEVIKPAVADHSGNIVKLTGDGLKGISYHARDRQPAALNGPGNSGDRFVSSGPIPPARHPATQDRSTT